MAKEVSDSLKHYCSTLQQPQHDDCPTGATSWRSFQRVCATGTVTHKPVKDPTSSCIQTLMTPIFDKLGSEKCLDDCTNLRSSNPNESFHHVLWWLTPKEQLNSSQELELVVNLSKCLFHSGFQWTVKNLFHQLDIQLPENTDRIFNCIYKICKYQSDYQITQESKTKSRKKPKKNRIRKNKLADIFKCIFSCFLLD